MKKNKVRGMFFLGLFFGLTVGGMLGIVIMGIELTNQQIKNQELSDWCGDKFEELGDMCIEKIRTTQTLCLFANDLSLKQRQDDSNNKVVK